MLSSWEWFGRASEVQVSNLCMTTYIPSSIPGTPSFLLKSPRCSHIMDLNSSTPFMHAIQIWPLTGLWVPALHVLKLNGRSSLGSSNLARVLQLQTASQGSLYSGFLHEQRFLPQHYTTFYSRSVDRKSPLQSIRIVTWWVLVWRSISLKLY